jgi:hypothetical protein
VDGVRERTPPGGGQDLSGCRPLRLDVTDDASMQAAVEQIERERRRAVSAKRPRTRYRVTASARLFITLRRLLPDRGWDALVGRSYPRP